MKTKTALMMIVLLLTLAACSLIPPTPETPPAEPNVPLGETFVLTPGEATQVADGLFLVGFDAVLEDSRCPANANCVWAGEVKVQVSVDGQLLTLTLGASTDTGENTADLGNGYLLTLLDVQPYPSLEADSGAPEISLVVTGP